MTLTFSKFSRWCSVSVDGDCVGYIQDDAGVVRLHLKKDAAEWLKDCRKTGPYKTILECQLHMNGRALVEDFRNADLSYFAKVMS